jgi:putative DNA primase/helicase
MPRFRRTIPHDDDRTQEPSRPIIFPVTIEQIPADLRALPQWVVWCYRYVIMREQPWTKDPLNPDGSGFASPRKPRTWGTFDQALAYYSRFQRHVHGLGFALTAEDGFVAVGVNFCRDPRTGTIAPWARAIVDRLASYSLWDPTEGGLQVVLRASLPPGRWRNGPVELYDRGRFLTVTGCLAEGAPLVIEARQAALDTLHAELFGGPASHEGRKGVRGV